MSGDGGRIPWPQDPDERLAKLVHDLRTPLTIVQGFAELLDRGHTTLDEARRSEYLGRIAQAGREMKDILDDEREDRLSSPLD
ncbi:histidine kinase dimerization/phospho-acceptor domain-containing protein [Baekduia sp. Peel2402]|uniref:histidine kinase dimerization/phospho-acceptor domain-containing protein n=1 Tax=Baekduia sp. Peel2402 TaxID=3458296 RepID=UPI00403E3B6F